LESSRLFFEHLAAEWDARQPADRREKLDQLIAGFDAQIKHCTKILEVGTGTGGLLPVLREHNAGAFIVQVDFANAMLACAQSNCNGDQLVQADAHHLPFQPGYFDMVICHNSFPHFKQKPLALQSIYKVLRSGGRLLILHEISRERVNAIHQNAAAMEIHQDLLPENDRMVRLLVKCRFIKTQVDDDQNRYSVIAGK
jgi:ubiquinone/menaquinone biosynthesis C-methylase UbiE